MKTKLYPFVLVLIVAGLVVSGCDRPAPLPTGVATSTQAITFPIPDRQTSIPQFGTQTAAAQTLPAVAVTPTLQPGVQKTPVPAKPNPTSAPTNPPVVVPSATARPVIAVPSPTPGRPSTYTIQSGDTFYCIARRYNLKIADLLNLNGLSNTSFAVIGQVIKIPSSGTWDDGPRALKDHPTSYTVQANDTLNKIACSFGDVDPNAILYANGMSSASDIHAGNTINIP
ncbi:MAG TPA: LysM peptidoglycan-binding domain-containing protein [Anaerolineaceae bacterium]|nr:LysM peptidoglycan-binding domain-containing protein [Anaerolineaceae bacterium]